ncbi:MAG: M50 family metallopeptidase [Clostridium sp.]
MALVLVVIHEISHYLAAYCFGFKDFTIQIMPFGGRLNLEALEDATPKQDLIISLAGPVSNFILAGIFYIGNIVIQNKSMELLIYSNLTLGVLNLLPSLPLDGGRVLRDILAIKLPYRKANNYSVIMSFFLGAFIAILYLILCFRGKGNILLGLIALLILVTAMKEKERVAYVIMSDIIKKKSKFLKAGYMENRSISISYKNDLLSALSLIDRNKYSIFLVIDEDMGVMDLVYENEIIKGISNYGNITLEEFMSKHEYFGEK